MNAQPKIESSTPRDYSDERAWGEDMDDTPTATPVGVSQTPRTDALTSDTMAKDYGKWGVAIDLALTLERENAALRAALEAITAYVETNTTTGRLQYAQPHIAVARAALVQS